MGEEHPEPLAKAVAAFDSMTGTTAVAKMPPLAAKAGRGA